MHALVELIAAMVAALAAAAFAQFGIELQAQDEKKQEEPEVRRTVQGGAPEDKPQAVVVRAASTNA